MFQAFAATQMVSLHALDESGGQEAREEKPRDGNAEFPGRMADDDGETGLIVKQEEVWAQHRFRVALSVLHEYGFAFRCIRCR